MEKSKNAYKSPLSGTAWAHVLFTATLAFLPVTSQSAGVSVVNLHSFDVFFNGEAPSGSLVQGPNGLFYGTTFEGGSANAGVIFDVSSNGAVNTLYTFTNGADGAFPQAGLFLANDGNFYGTTAQGGTNGTGVLFRMTPAGAFGSLYSFTPLAKSGQNQDGAYPGASLVQASDGNLYGTSSAGGTNGSGTLFKISPSGTFQFVYAFSALDASGENSEGADPEAALIQGADANLYGTAYGGGSNGFGTVFSYSVALGQVSSVYSFQNAGDGANPLAALVQGTDGYFYGTASQGGSESDGTLFKISGKGVFALLHSFSGDTDGANPLAPLVEGTNGNFYGTCANSGNGFGTVFEATTNGSVTPLYAFTGGNDGANPAAGLVPTADGVFFGTASSGGSDNLGAVFSITSNGTFTPVMSFIGGGDGSNPQAPLVQGTNGNFYGVTFQGGADGFGVAFELTTSGEFNLLYTFTNGLDGSFPSGGLALGADGNFYGESLQGGVGNNGVLFTITPQGTLKALSPLTNSTIVYLTNSFGVVQAVTVNVVDGNRPFGGFVLGTNGNFYGTASQNGNYENKFDDAFGTVFEMTPTGNVTALFTFTNVPFTDWLDGGNPESGVVQGIDGNFYGTTMSGGSNQMIHTLAYGTIFKLTPDGALTTLHVFTNGLDGRISLCRLVQSSNGNFYGTASAGGAYGCGTIYSITPAGSFTPLYAFTNGIDGAHPLAGLTIGPDGNLYGTASAGGSRGLGTIFEISTNGVFTALYSFTGANDGSTPSASLVLGADGNLYGTTEFGGASDGGTAFEVVLPTLTAPSFTSIVPGPSTITVSWNTVPGHLYQLQASDDLSKNAWVNLGVPTNGVSGTASFVDGNAGNVQRYYRVNSYAQ